MTVGCKGMAMVQIQSKQERGMIASALLGFIPDILISWTASYYFDSGIVGFIAVAVGLQCVYFLIWVKTTIWTWLIFWISGRRKMAAGFEQYLSQNRFPQPPGFLSGIDHYFMHI